MGGLYSAHSLLEGESMASLMDHKVNIGIEAIFDGNAAKAAIINNLALDVHEANAKWWIDLQTGEPLKRNIGELLCLVHSEIDEAQQGRRNEQEMANNIYALYQQTVSINGANAEALLELHRAISRAMEGHRKSIADDKLPHRTMFEVELADAFIRILDLAAGNNLDLGGAYVEKMAYNAQRADHTREARLAPGGKAY
jgi:hypothetical protein